jgi:Trypsin-co-occurring domain 1
VESGITAGGIGEVADDASGRHFVPLQIGAATVFVEQAPTPIDVDLSGEIHPVALPSPKEAMEQAANFLQELVGIFDKRIKALAKRPEEVSVELALGFEVKGKATLIPVLLSGETKAQAAIKVSAKWGAAAEEQT